MLKQGQYTNLGWIVAHWKARPDDKPVTLTENCAYYVVDSGGARWVWGSAVLPADAPTTLPHVSKNDREARTALIRFLSPYGGNAWVARMVDITKPTVVYTLGNRLWPRYNVLKKMLHENGGSYTEVARLLNTTVGNLRRVEAVATGASARTYRGRAVNPYPKFDGKRP